jgi:hypothetical protein
MRRLVQVIADSRPGELAFAELLQRVAMVVPDAIVNPTVVDAGDTLAAGLCVAQLALADGPPGWLVLHYVGSGERLCVGRSRAGALVVGPDAGWSWSFVADELRELYYLDVSVRGARVPAYDLVPRAVRHAVAGHPHAVSDTVPRDRVPAVPPCAVAWIDRAGNLKTTLSRPPAAVGQRLRVKIGAASETAIVADDRLAVPDGQLALSPCSLGWPTHDGGRVRLLELLVHGGSAAERFDHPRSGAPIALAPAQPRAA